MNAHNATVGLAFVQNPFRRVLSGAAMDVRGIINASLLHSGEPQDLRRQASLFQAWLRAAHQPPVFPATHVLERLRAHAAASGAKLRFDMLGRTASLAEELPVFMRQLGYAAVTGPFVEKTHCISSCGANETTDDPRERVAWFSEEDAGKMHRWFGADFDTFGFSRDPGKMWLVD